MDTSQIHKLEKLLGYRFKNKDLLVQALSHRSAGSAHYERLEFLGDSILGFIIADEIYLRFPEASEGQMTRLRSNLVKGKTLAILAKQLSIGDFLILGSGEMKSGGHRRDSILADAIEALIATIYLESGLEACRERLISWYGDILTQANPADISKDAKTLLQERMQSLKLPLPTYSVIDVTGKEHQRQFKVRCECSGNKHSFACDATATASNRREAEKLAAEQILQILNQKKT